MTRSDRMLSLQQRTGVFNNTARYVICLHFNVTIELNMADQKARI
jgi:hypothetical protein